MRLGPLLGGIVGVATLMRRDRPTTPGSIE